MLFYVFLLHVIAMNGLRGEEAIANYACPPCIACGCFVALVRLTHSASRNELCLKANLICHFSFTGPRILTLRMRPVQFISLHLGQVLMHKANSHGAFTYG